MDWGLRFEFFHQHSTQLDLHFDFDYEFSKFLFQCNDEYNKLLYSSQPKGPE